MSETVDINTTTASKVSDLSIITEKLAQDFIKQILALSTTKRYHDSLYWWVATEWWQFGGGISVFDKKLTVDVRRIWKNVNDNDELGFDPRPDTEEITTIKLYFDLEQYNYDDWNKIVNDLEDRIKKHHLIKK